MNSDFRYINEKISIDKYLQYTKILKIFYTQYFNVNFNTKECDIIFAPWLIYILQIYEFSKDKEKVIKIGKSDWAISYSDQQFHSLIRKKEFHETLRNIIEEPNKDWLLTSETQCSPKRSRASQFRYFIQLIFLNIKIKPIRIVKEANFSELSIQTILKSFFYGEIPIFSDLQNESFAYQSNMRYELLEFLNKHTVEEQHALNIILSITLPVSLFEGLPHAIQNIKRFTVSNGVIILKSLYETSVSSRLLALYSRQKDSSFVIMQHGGHYGTFKYTAVELVEVLISDFYLTFGWTQSPYQKVRRTCAKIIPFGNKKFNSVLKFDNNNNKILFVSNSFPLVFYRNWSAPTTDNELEQYFSDKIKFISKLNWENKANIIVRLHPNHIHTKEKENLENAFYGLGFEDATKSSLYASFKRSKIIITENNHTVLLQALASGIPTLIYLRNYAEHLRNSALVQFKALGEVGILHDTPEAAADFVNNLNIGEWWSNPKLQRVRLEFCKKFNGLAVSTKSLSDVLQRS